MKKKDFDNANDKILRNQTDVKFRSCSKVHSTTRLLSEQAEIKKLFLTIYQKD